MRFIGQSPIEEAYRVCLRTYAVPFPVQAPNWSIAVEICYKVSDNDGRKTCSDCHPEGDRNEHDQGKKGLERSLDVENPVSANIADGTNKDKGKCGYL